MKKLLNVLLVLCFMNSVALAQDANTASADATNNVAQGNAQATATSTNAAPANAVPANPAPIKNSDLNIIGAYVQPLIPGQNNTAGFMTLENNSKETYVLTGASSSIAEKVELHSVTMQDGVIQMRPVKAITILPGQSLVLQPGDFHLMLMGVNTVLTKDTLVPLCLEFQNSAVICRDVPVIDKRTKDQHQH